MVTVTVNGIGRRYNADVTFEQLAQEHQHEYKHRIVLAVVNGKIKELFKKPDSDCELTFLTLHDRIGHDTYQRSATMLLVKAISDVAGSCKNSRVTVEFSLGKGYYCRPCVRRSTDVGSETGEALVMDAAFVDRVRERMEEMVRLDYPIHKRAYPADEAIRIFAAQGMEDKVRLFRYRRGSYINVYCLDGYHDYNYGYMVPSTGYLKSFDLVPYEEGLVLVLPDITSPDKTEPFHSKDKLFRTLELSERWGDQIGIDTVADLNDKICGGDLAELILVQEALQERRIGEIASEIAAHSHVKFVMIAGPSSSGKTTFSHRLSIQLKTYGLTPHPIGIDDYFLNREQTPRDEDGNYNFECLEALDVAQFNEDMCNLLAGEKVEMPRFNFITGKREYRGDYLQLGPEDILVIEGIHGLNDRLSHSLPLDSKFKIYISALTTLNVDDHNRISTTDGRLLRRMVRDARTRGTSAAQTIKMWPSVGRGEEVNIFPYQESADVMFNSALIYELAVLKQFAEPLLFGIGKEEPEYYEAKRLLKFMDYFLGVSSEKLPINSIIREFVGGSCFRV